MSCLFDSLSMFLEHMNSAMLRSNICDYLETNPLLIDDLKACEVINHETNYDLETYVSNMRSQSTMGGAIEIRAFTKIFQVNVKVLSMPNQKVIEFLENPHFAWFVIQWTGNHFDPIKIQS